MNTLIADIDRFLASHQHGWCSEIKAHTLAAIIVALRPAVTVEIGVYAGKSGISMALAHKFIQHGSVMGIDPYTKEAATEGYEGDHKKWWSEVVNLEDILSLFLERVERYGLGEYITLYRSKSDDAPVPDVIGLLHIDGQHTNQAIKDVERFASHVSIGGVTVMDDINWPGGGVSRAVQKLIELGFVELYTIDGGAVYQRIKHPDNGPTSSP